MVPRDSGCAFGKVSRNMIENQRKEFDGFKKYISDEFKDMKATNKQLYNHLSNRLPIWVTVLFTSGGSLIVGLVVKAVYG